MWFSSYARQFVARLFQTRSRTSWDSSLLAPHRPPILGSIPTKPVRVRSQARDVKGLLVRRVFDRISHIEDFKPLE